MHLAQLGNPNVDTELQCLVAVYKADFIIHLTLKTIKKILTKEWRLSEFNSNAQQFPD